MFELVKEKLNEVDLQLHKLKSLIIYMDDAKEIIQENQSLTESFISFKGKSEELFNSAEKLFLELTSNEFKRIPSDIVKLDEKLSQNQESISSLISELKEILESEIVSLKQQQIKTGEDVLENYSNLLTKIDSFEIVHRFSQLDESFDAIRQFVTDSLSKLDLIGKTISLNQKATFDFLIEIKDIQNDDIAKSQEHYSAIVNTLQEISEEGSKEFEIIINSLSESMQVISKNNEILINKIDSFEFVKRFTKFDDSLFSIQQSIINNQSRIESIERNIKDEIAYKVGDIKTELLNELKEMKSRQIEESLSQKRAITEFKDSLTKMIETHKEETSQGQAKIRIILWILIVLQLTGFLWLILKK